jgi:hypothetical protein
MSSWALVNSCYSGQGSVGGGGPYTSPAFSNPLTPGSLLVAILGLYNNSYPVTSFTDLAGNTFQDSGAGFIEGTGSYGIQVYIAINQFSTASNTFTLKQSNGDIQSIAAFEFTGNQQSLTNIIDAIVSTGMSPVDGTGTGNDTLVMTAGTTTTTGDLIFAACSTQFSRQAAGTSPIAFNQLGSVSGWSVLGEWAVQNAPSTITPTWSTVGGNDQFGYIWIAFKPHAGVFTLNAHGGNTGLGESVAVTLSGVSAGDLITVQVSVANVTGGVAVSDNVNNENYQAACPWTLDAVNTGGGEGIFYLIASAAGSVTVTAAWPAAYGNQYYTINAQSWTYGPGQYPQVDTGMTQYQTKTGTANPNSGNNLMPNYANELIIGFMFSLNQTATAGANYALLDASIPFLTFPEYWIQTTPTATNAPYTMSSDTWVEQMVGFYLTTQPPSPTGPTTLYLKQMLNSDTSLGKLYNYANPVRSVLSPITSITNTTASGANIQVTASAGGTLLKWISQPLASPVTISGAITMNTWGLESNAAANATFAFTIKKYTAGGEGRAILLNKSFGTELTTSNAVQNWTANPLQQTTFAVGDRIVIICLITNAGGAMGAARTVTLNYGGKTAAASGDVWVKFTERVVFQVEPECIQQVQAFSSSNVTSITETFSGITAKGSTILVYVSWGSATGPPTLTASDNQAAGSNAYLILQAFPDWDFTTVFISDALFYAPNIAGGVALAVKVSSTIISNNAQGISITVQEWAGLAAAPLDQQSNSSASSGTAVNSGSITPTFAKCLCWGEAQSSQGNSSAPSQQYSRSSTNPWLYDFVLDNITVESLSAVGAGSGPWVAYIASLKSSGQQNPAYNPPLLGRKLDPPPEAHMLVRL